MNEFAPCILGIDAGSRQIGISVLRGEELVFYAVKTIKRKSRAETVRRLQKTLTILTAKYGIEVIALEKIAYSQQRKAFARIVYEKVREFGLEKHVRLLEYDPAEIRRTLCGLKKPTKRNTALILAQRYTELARYFNVPKLWQKRYFAQMFDAIAAGLVCALELKKTEPPSATDSD